MQVGWSGTESYENAVTTSIQDEHFHLKSGKQQGEVLCRNR